MEPASDEEKDKEDEEEELKRHGDDSDDGDVPYIGTVDATPTVERTTRSSSRKTPANKEKPAEGNPPANKEKPAEGNPPEDEEKPAEGNPPEDEGKPAEENPDMPAKKKNLRGARGKRISTPREKSEEIKGITFYFEFIYIDISFCH